jgi:mono/diheme cytochrome c family protein
LTCTLLFALALPAVALADGAAIYKTKCTPCHGVEGSDQTPVGKNLKVRDLRSAEVQKLTDADIAKVLRRSANEFSTRISIERLLPIAF